MRRHVWPSTKSRLMLGAGCIALASPAVAQSQSGIETVVVTGSRIPQIGLYSAEPVTAVGQQELKLEGTTDVTTLINNLPAAFVDQNEGVSNGATGTANVDLRNLGAKRTLVLVDGTRLMPGDPSDPVADLNDIPAALVDHVEVETGGASAVYGSDALAGVVNFIMRKDFEGVELDGTYSVANNANDNSYWRDLTQQELGQGAYGFSQSPKGIWNGQTEDTTLLAGINSGNGKGNVTAFLGYRDVAAVLESSRDYSECTIASTGPGFGCSGSSNYNDWISFDNYYAGQSYNFFETGNGKPGSGKFVPFTGAPSQLFNYGAFNYIQRPDVRYTGGFFAHYDENTAFEFYANFLFSDDHTVAQIAPSGLFLGGGTGPSDTVYVNCDNPLMTPQENALLCGGLAHDTLVSGGPDGSYWNGAGNAAAYTGNPGGVAGQANLYIGRRDIEGGDRQADLRHTAYRLQIGARGDLGDGWSYNLYAQEGLTVYEQFYLNEFSVKRTQAALEVDPGSYNPTTHQYSCYGAESSGGVTPSAPGCVPLDIFNGLGSITPAMLDYARADGLQNGFTEEKIVSGSLTGNLGEWGLVSPWAKDPVGVALGSEYRQERLSLNADEEFSTGDLAGQGAPTYPVPTSGFNVSEAFGEVQVPVVEGLPYLEDVLLKSGYRYSSYDLSGQTSTWYASAEWQPVEDVRFRASMQRAVRAPNVLELYSPNYIGLFEGQDPCASTTAGRCATVPNAGSSLLLCPATQCSAQYGGNVHLKPEVSNTRSVGVVLTPTFVDGLTATVDYWDIDVSNYIGTLGGTTILAGCYVSNNPLSQNYFCPFVHRAASGVLYGGGYVFDPTINTGYLKTRGVDFEVNWQGDTADWWGLNEGQVAVNMIATFTDELITEPLPQTLGAVAVGNAYNCAGLFGLVCTQPTPKWRHKLRVTWTTPWDVDLSLQWRFVGAMALDFDSSNPLVGGSSGPGTSYAVCANGLRVPYYSSFGIYDCADSRLSSYSYFDLTADFTVREGMDLRVGVENVFDIEPPVNSAFSGFGNGNTYPGLYDAVGRTVFVAATIKY